MTAAAVCLFAAALSAALSVAAVFERLGVYADRITQEDDA